MEVDLSPEDDAVQQAMTKAVNQIGPYQLSMFHNLCMFLDILKSTSFIILFTMYIEKPSVLIFSVIEFGCKFSLFI